MRVGTVGIQKSEISCLLFELYILDKAKGLGTGVVGGLQNAGMGMLGQFRGLGMATLGQLRQTGIGAVGNFQSLSQGMLGQV